MKHKLLSLNEISRLEMSDIERGVIHCVRSIDKFQILRQEMQTMTVKEVIAGFREGVEENTERDAYANELFQEAVRIGMELNAKYHTPEELREIMGRLTGKKIDRSFRMFPPFYTDFEKNITIGKEVFINSGCHYQDQGGIEIGDACVESVMETLNRGVRLIDTAYMYHNEVICCEV